MHSWELGGVIRHRIEWPHLEESQARFFDVPRDAIDAAMAAIAAKDGKA